MSRERAEDPHHRVVQARRRKRDDRHRLAGHRVVAIGDVHRRLLVAARQPLRRLVAAVVDERLVKPSEARRGIGGDVLEVECLEHVHHEVRARVLDGLDVGLVGQWCGLGCQLLAACSGVKRRGAPARGAVTLRRSAPTPGTVSAAAPAAPAAAPLRNPRRFTWGVRVRRHNDLLNERSVAPTNIG